MSEFFPFLEFVEHKIVADGGVERVLARTSDVEPDKHHEIDERQFFGSKGIAPVDNKEGYAHRDDHRDEDDALQKAEDESKGTYDLGEDGEPERQVTAYAYGVGVEAGQSGVGHQFIVAVAEEE